MALEVDRQALNTPKSPIPHWSFVKCQLRRFHMCCLYLDVPCTILLTLSIPQLSMIKSASQGCLMLFSIIFIFCFASPPRLPPSFRQQRSRCSRPTPTALQPAAFASQQATQKLIQQVHERRNHSIRDDTYLLLVTREVLGFLYERYARRNFLRRRNSSERDPLG